MNAVANSFAHLLGGDVHTLCHSSNSVQWQTGFALSLPRRKLCVFLPGTYRNGLGPQELGYS